MCSCHVFRALCFSVDSAMPYTATTATATATNTNTNNNNVSKWSKVYTCFSRYSRPGYHIHAISLIALLVNWEQEQTTLFSLLFFFSFFFFFSSFWSTACSVTSHRLHTVRARFKSTPPPPPHCILTTCFCCVFFVLLPTPFYAPSHV